MSRLLPFILILLVVAGVIVAVLLLSRRGNNNVPFAVNDRALLACTETCAGRGQCGTLDNSRRVVLANAAGPVVKNHDRLYQDGSQAIIVDLADRELIAARNGAPLIGESDPFRHTFYLVQSQEGKTAWVSGWCLARPE